MTAPSGAYVLKDVLLTIEGTDFANQVQKVRFVPEVTRETMKTLVPDGVVNDVTTTWTVEISGVQDWETNGIADFMADNAGTAQTVVFAPRKGTGRRQATAEVVMQPVDFGGEQGQWNTFEVTLGVNGVPTFGTQA